MTRVLLAVSVATWRMMGTTISISRVPHVVALFLMILDDIMFPPAVVWYYVICIAAFPDALV